MAPTTRRQQKQVLLQDSLKSLQLSADSTTPITRQQRRRKAPAHDLEGSRKPKRIYHDKCTDGYCLASREQTDATSTEVEALRDSTLVNSSAVHHESSSAQSPAPGQAASTLPIGFLALPRELRDEVYKHVLNSAEKRAVTLQARNFITKSGLVCVTKQIKEEFLDAVLFHAPVIHTTVKNHNFAHIVTFLNRLSDAQMHKFAAASTPNSDPEATMRSRKIIITLTYSHTKASTKAQLNRWLDRFDDPTRRGAEVRFQYRLDRESWQCGGYKQRVRDRTSAGPRSREEGRKILEVTRGVSSGYWI